MDALARLPSREIADVMRPTMELFQPLLQVNAGFIDAVPRSEHAYGSHPRQTLDVFTPDASIERPPVLLFVPGGGLVAGSKDMYHHIGAFFARRGFVAACMSYRLVIVGDGAEDSARYPSGGIDVGLALRWLHDNLPALRPGTDIARMSAMGSSAGGSHLMTFLLDPACANGVKLHKAVSLGTACDWSYLGRTSQAVVDSYFGTAQAASWAHSPAGLFESASDAQLGALPSLLFLNTPNEPDGIILPFKALEASLAKRGYPCRSEITPALHNHISVCMSPCSGIGEEWAERVANWLNE